MLGWFKDYQTLTSALVALAGAWVATRPLFAQLREMGHQSAAIAVPSLRVIAVEIEEEMSHMKLADRVVEWRLVQLIESYVHDDPLQTYQTWPGQAAEVSNGLFDAWQYLGNRVEQTALPADAPQRAGLSILRALMDAVAELAYAFKADTTGPDYEEGEGDVSSEEEQRRRARMDAELASWRAWYLGYVPLAQRARATAWERVRQMERVAADGEVSSGDT
jgi:hypothetical protein